MPTFIADLLALLRVVELDRAAKRTGLGARSSILLSVVAAMAKSLLDMIH
jgi:hypothetical protein